jgi:hypothetical protein
MFKVRYKTRRGKRQGWIISYTYYKARITKNGRAFLLGHFATPEDAAAAYRKAKSKHAAR